MALLEALSTSTALGSAVESCRRGILEEKCVITAGFVGWTFLVPHVPTVIDVQRHCGEGIFSFPFLLRVYIFFLSRFS